MMGKSKRFSRRSMLRGSLVLTSGAVLAACGATPAATTAPVAEATATAAPAAEATATVVATAEAAATTAPTAAAGEKVIIRWQDWGVYESQMDLIKELVAEKIPTSSSNQKSPPSSSRRRYWR